MKVIRIDHSELFNPNELIGEDWTIVEEDEHSLALNEFNLDEVKLVTVLEDGEAGIRGEEMLRRLKEAGHIRLDAKTFQTIWRHQDFIPEPWKKKTGTKPNYIFFCGTILCDQDGNRYVLCLYWDGYRWRWHYYDLAEVWNCNHLSAVLTIDDDETRMAT